MTTQAREAIKVRKHVFKGCLRCGGDLRLEHDADLIPVRNPFSYVCLQCGGQMPVRAVLGRPREAEAVAAA